MAKCRFLASLQNTRNSVAKTESYDAVLCTQGRGERDRCNVLVRKACDMNMRQYGRSKFAKLCVDFWAPDKIGQNYVEMTLYVAVRCIWGRGERYGCIVLW